MSDLNLAARARNGASIGFGLSEAIGEAIGYASMCWSEVPAGTFESDRASAVAKDLENAIGIFIQRAVNEQAIDAGYGAADWEIAELIGQSQAFGFKGKDEQ